MRHNGLGDFHENERFGLVRGGKIADTWYVGNGADKTKGTTNMEPNTRAEDKLIAAIEAHPTMEQVQALIEVARAACAYCNEPDEESHRLWKARSDADAALLKSPTFENAEAYRAVLEAERVRNNARQAQASAMFRACARHAALLEPVIGGAA